MAQSTTTGAFVTMRIWDTKMACGLTHLPNCREGFRHSSICAVKYIHNYTISIEIAAALAYNTHREESNYGNTTD
jgi:hypothetical protein